MTPLIDQETAGAPLPRHDWSARARSSALEALRYTKFVGVAKRALQVAAFAVIAAVLVIGVVLWMNRFWPEKHVVDEFFTALQQQNFEQAYGVWMHDPQWKQHPERYSRYSYNEFKYYSYDKSNH